MRDLLYLTLLVRCYGLELWRRLVAASARAVSGPGMFRLEGLGTRGLVTHQAVVQPVNRVRHGRSQRRDNLGLGAIVTRVTLGIDASCCRLGLPGVALDWNGFLCGTGADCATVKAHERQTPDGVATAKPFP